MKDYIKAIIGIFLVLICSCKNITDENQQNTKNMGKACLVIKFMSNARTVLPQTLDFENDMEMSFELKGSLQGKTQQTIKTWICTKTESAYTVMTNDTTVLLDTGIWNFKITAQKDEKDVLEGTLTNVQIKEGINQLNFGMLDRVADGFGNVNITLSFVSEGGVKAVKGGLYNLNGNPLEGYEEETLVMATFDGKNSVTYAKEGVADGTYLVKVILFRDEQTTDQMNVYTEVVRVASGHTSSAQRNIDNLNTLYTITYNLVGGEYTAGFTAQASFTQYTNVALPTAENLTKMGYTFAGWENGSGDTVTQIATGTTGDITLTAKWNANTDTAYRVEHHQQNIADDNYAFFEAESKTGTTEDQTAATARTYTGFTAQPTTQETIKPDGSTVVKVYYDRNKYSVTFNANGGTLTGSATQSVKHGAKATEPAEPTREDMVFGGWYSDENCTNPFSFETAVTSDILLYAKWRKVENIGDIAYSDGTVSENYDSTKKPVGIVFEVVDGYATKIVSLDQGDSLKWSTESVLTNATSLTDGKSNLEVIKAIEGWQDKYPAFKWCDEYTDASNNSEWYLPAIYELNQVYVAKEAINEAIEKITSAGGSATLLVVVGDGWFWASSEFGVNYVACAQRFSSGGRGGNGKDNPISVRAIRAFNN